MKKSIVSAAALLLIASTAQAQVVRISPDAHPIGASSTSLPIAPMVRNPPTVDLSLQVRSGEMLSERLVEWASRHGYVMSWQAPEFRSHSSLSLNKPFDETLEAFGAAMKRNGVHLTFEIFQNNAVRVQEVK